MRIFGVRKSFIEKIFPILTGAIGILAAFWLIPGGADMAKPGIIGIILGFAWLVMAQKFAILGFGNNRTLTGAVQTGALPLYLKFCASTEKWSVLYAVYSAFCIMSAVKNPCWAFGYGFFCGAAFGAFVRAKRLYNLLCEMMVKEKSRQSCA